MSRKLVFTHKMCMRAFFIHLPKHLLHIEYYVLSITGFLVRNILSFLVSSEFCLVRGRCTQSLNCTCNANVRRGKSTSSFTICNYIFQYN